MDGREPLACCCTTYEKPTRTSETIATMFGASLMTTYKGKHIQTVDEVKYILKILLREISTCEHKQKHIEGLRQALLNEQLVATAAQILQEEREALL